MTEDKLLKNKTILVKKRNGSMEPLNVDKIHKMAELACDGISGVSVSDIVMKAHLSFFDGISSTEIHRSITKAAADLITEATPNYQYVAGRLLNYDIRKMAWGGMEPPRLYDHICQMVEDGYYTPELFSMYTEEEWDKIDSFIDHDRDLEMTHIGVSEYMTKYAVRDRSLKEVEPLETPQLTYILIAAVLCHQEKSLKAVKSYYNDISNWNISLPTPIMAGVRTKSKQASSCTLIECGDSLNSISKSSEAIVKYVSNKAGIGLETSAIRVEGDPIRNGEAKHTGTIPFYKLFEASVKSCSQGGVRGGSMTLYTQLWRSDIEDILVLKNNKGTPDTRVRKIDYGIQINNYLYNRLIKNENISLFSPADVPGLRDAFFKSSEEFAKLYEKYEKDKSIKKKTISALELFTKLMMERKDTGRIYIFNSDNVNSHSNFDDPVKMSNLCVAGDTVIPVRINGDVKAQISIKNLNDTVTFHNNLNDFEVLSKNIKTGEIEYKKILSIGMTNPMAMLFNLAVNNGGYELHSLWCTSDHKIYEPKMNQYLKFSELNDSNYIDSINLGEITIDNFLHSSVIRVEPVYDITVEDNNNFYANGILVHNCAEIVLPTEPMGKTEEHVFYIDLNNFKNEYDKIINELNNNTHVNSISLSDSDSDTNKVKLSVETDESRIALCTLSAINLGNIKNLDDLEKIMWNAVSKLDNLLDYQDYMVPASKQHTLDYRPLGIGIVNLAYYLAKNGYKFSDEGSLQLLHDTFEAMSFYAIKASMELAKIKGPCRAFHKTKFSKGILPIDNYNKNVDKLVAPNYKLDWEWLRKEVVKNGIRNATLLANMPAECNKWDNKIKTVEHGDVNFHEIAQLFGINWEAVEDDGIPLQFPIEMMVHTSDKPRLATKLMYNGKQDLYELTFSDDSKYSFTLNHKFLCPYYGWKAVHDLNVGDYVSKRMLNEFDTTLVWLKIKDKKIISPDHVWDIEVEEVNSYLMSNGINSHNSSAKIMNATNGQEAVRSLITVKGNKSNISKQVVPEINRLKNKYEMLWDMKSMDGVIKTSAVMQKFVCQSLSTNLSYNPAHYANGEIPMSVLLGDLLKCNYFGIKTLYYNNINDQKDVDMVEEKVDNSISTITEIELKDDVCDSCTI
jgi:ribonucleotide reductase alpha subunit